MAWKPQSDLLWRQHLETFTVSAWLDKKKTFLQSSIDTREFTIIGKKKCMNSKDRSHTWSLILAAQQKTARSHLFPCCMPQEGVMCTSHKDNRRQRRSWVWSPCATTNLHSTDGERQHNRHTWLQSEATVFPQPPQMFLIFLISI